MKRTVKVSKEKKSPLGAWSIVCDSCPLLPHLKALGKNPERCGFGITTNMQGPVVMGTCKHYQKDSIVADGKKLTVECTRE